MPRTTADRNKTTGAVTTWTAGSGALELPAQLRSKAIVRRDPAGIDLETHGSVKDPPNPQPYCRRLCEIYPHSDYPLKC